MSALTCTVQNQNITLLLNPSYEEGASLTDIGLRWFGNSQEAIFRVGKIIEQSAKLTNEAIKSSGRLPSDSLKGIAKGAGIMWHGTGPFRLPSALKDAHQEISHWIQGKTSPVDGGRMRRMTKLINSVCEAVEMTMVSLNMLFSSFVKTSPICKPIGLIADVTSWTADFTSASLSLQNLSKARETMDKSQNPSVDFKQSLAEIHCRNLISVAKEICGVIGASFGVLAFTTGFAVAPVLAISISLAGTLFAVWGRIYEDSMKYKCNFFSDKNIQLV